MQKKTLEIIFENEQFVAVNKPAGLLTIPDRYNQSLASLFKILEAKYKKIFTVHRLDRDTSGLILFAKNETAHKYLSGLFEMRNVEKFYLGIVQGTLRDKAGIIDEPVAEHPVLKKMIVSKKGKASVTAYEVLEDHFLYSLVKFKILSGRTHQIRVHMQYLGHPVVCDEIYGSAQPVYLSSFRKKYKLSRNDEKERPILERLALHSRQIIFPDASGKLYDFTAELPKDMKAFLQQLGKLKIKQ